MVITKGSKFQQFHVPAACVNVHLMQTRGGTPLQEANRDPFPHFIFFKGSHECADQFKHKSESPPSIR